MARLSIYLLGPYEIYLDDVKVEGLYSQAHALLAYLVVESHRKHSREKLAEMLWPDDSRDFAKQNLRQAISRLRSALGDKENEQPFIHATRTDVQFNPLSDFWCDSEVFKHAIGTYQNIGGKTLSLETLGWMQEAAERYRGHFFEHFHTRYSERYQEWAHTHAESLKCKAITVVEQLCRYYEQEGDLAEAINSAHKIVSIERWSEGPRRLLVRLLAESGQEVAALAQCDSCRSMLRDELGVEFSPEMLALFENIKRRVPRGDRRLAPETLDNNRQGHECRHVTILSCSVDLHTDQQPDQVISAVRQFTQTCRNVASRYGGFPYALSGDECSICFGYPASHDNTAVAAARAAMALRKIYRDLHRASTLKIALCTGEVLVMSYKGAVLPHLIGNPVTQANFLRHMTRDGECSLEDSTYRSIRRYFACQRCTNPAMDQKLGERFYFLLQHEFKHSRSVPERRAV